MNELTIIKQNEHGIETWRYYGHTLKQWESAILFEARFNRPDMEFNGMVFAENDHFIEIYFSDRWYNIFEIHDREDDHLKGWYCNIGMPAQITPTIVSYRDLALDLLVFPDGNQITLDFEEFDNLEIDTETRHSALSGYHELSCLFRPPIIIRLSALFQ